MLRDWTPADDELWKKATVAASLKVKKIRKEYLKDGRFEVVLLVIVELPANNLFLEGMFGI